MLNPKLTIFILRSNFKFKNIMATRKLTINEFRKIVKQIIKEEMETSDIKTGSTYNASMPMDSEGKKRIDVKVKVLGKDRDDPNMFIVTPLENKRYTVDGRSNEFTKDKHYGILAKYLKA
jgi:hypothetical protein